MYLYYLAQTITVVGSRLQGHGIGEKDEVVLVIRCSYPCHSHLLSGLRDPLRQEGHTAKPRGACGQCGKVGH